MSNTVYNANNEIFAQFDEDKGWCFKGEKLGLEEFTPFSEVGHEKVKTLYEAFVQSGYPISLSKLVYDCYLMMSATVAIAEKSLEEINRNRPHDMQLAKKPLTPVSGEVSKVRSELANRFKAAFDGESEEKK